MSKMKTLREFWEELRHAKADGTAPSPSRAGSGYTASSGRLLSGSGSGRGSGSGGAGYGLGLIAPDRFSQQRIMAIMRELCEKDAERSK